jgi:hypothetical protein
MLSFFLNMQYFQLPLDNKKALLVAMCTGHPVKSLYAMVGTTMTNQLKQYTKHISSQCPGRLRTAGLEVRKLREGNKSFLRQKSERGTGPKGSEEKELS